MRASVTAAPFDLRFDMLFFHETARHASRIIFYLRGPNAGYMIEDVRDGLQNISEEPAW